jgi:hypothetical protein
MRLRWLGLLAAATALAAVVAGLAWLVLAPREVPAGQPALATLDADSLPQLRARLDSDGVRVLAMLSPT